MSGEKWFHRGKDARRRGLDRVILDARLSIASRRQFFAGWDDEDRRRAPQPTAEQVEESHRVAAKLKDFARTLKGATE
jgi:hypothetical protein